ncbi:high-affinity nitrate transporter 3.1-like [Primulina tabacum]|uniref:high-affinity nitrate transporter 3.1-like n=1 Tax=Primulina tabacum TaxID=48773 RepID=UPI003F5A884B
MALQAFLLASFVFSWLASTSKGVTTFSSLQQTLIVTASPHPGQVMNAGEDKITVTWSLNTSLQTGVDSTYKTIKIKLCYSPISQKDRGWRKTVDILAKDKTCQHKMGAQPYTNASNNSLTLVVQRDVPTATYFIRVYACNSADEEVAYGQTTDSKKGSNLFEVRAISGRHTSLDIASVCFSTFSVVSLFGFFFIEKRKAKALQTK